MRTYDILRDFGIEDEAADRITLNAGCVIAVYRHRYPVTYSRKKQSSFSQYIAQASELQDKIIIVEDVTSVMTNQSKSNHVGSLNAVFKPGRNYSTELMPGDYMFCWLVQSQEDVESLVKRLENDEPCNEFMDGLKFFGKVNSCRKRFITNPMTGSRSVQHFVSANGFTEFDASIYFEPYLALKNIGLASDWLQGYGIKLNKIINDNGTGIGVNNIIPVLLQVFFGTGIPKNRGVPPANANVTEGLDNPNSFVVPKQIAKVFGVTNGSKPNGQAAYTDILEIVHGIQKYDGDRTNANVVDSTSDSRGVLFQPRGADGTAFHGDNPLGGFKVHYTGIPQLGTFVPNVPAMSGQKTAWSLIRQFLNDTINEVYCTLRTNANGKIVPTFVCRQLPFSSGMLSKTFVPKPIKTADEAVVQGLDFTGDEPTVFTEDTRNSVNVEQTLFSELPRWRIHPVFIRNFDLGRADALRFNFIDIRGESGGRTGTNTETGQFVRNPPIADDLDIARSGLRPYMRSVPCAPADIVNGGPGAWMYLLSDFLMGQHLMLTGQLETEGIQQPIAIGDNIELDDTILHIEAISHMFSVDSMGHKMFRTTMNLTHGMSAQQLTGDDNSLYSGISPNQLTRFEPAISTDGGIERSESED